jgi:AraC-like DNA-binding protein
MYVARTRWERSDAKVVGALVLFEGARVQVMRTDGLVVDARFLAPVGGESSTAHVFVVLEGWIDVDGHERVEAPAVVVLDRTEFESRVEGARAFRLGGSPRCSIEVSLDRAHLVAPAGAAHGAFRASKELALASRHFARSVDGVDVSGALGRFVAALDAAGLCRIPLVSIESDRRSLQRLLDALSPLYGVQRSGAYGDLVAELAGVSPRQISRDMRELARLARFPGSTLREMFRVLRLRRAALLLSCQSLTIEEVAREVGYGSADAMGRAFRDAGLPSPSEARRTILHERS